MKYLAAIIATFLFLYVSVFPADAQVPSVVQLPSFHTFSYRGSVLVPDSGATSLGGVKRSASGYNHRGWNRGYGSMNSTSNASISARIIDLAEMDRQILGGTPHEFLRRMQMQDIVDRRESRAGTPEPRLSPTEEGKALVRFARKEYRAGRKSASMQAYQMAIAKLDGHLQTLAESEFRRTFGSIAEQVLQFSSLAR